jgi:hypothetical protein
MTQISFKTAINDTQMSVLLYLLKSWNVDAEVSGTSDERQKIISGLPFSAGMWEDYEIDDKTLRAKAWGTEKNIVAV